MDKPYGGELRNAGFWWNRVVGTTHKDPLQRFEEGDIITISRVVSMVERDGYYDVETLNTRYKVFFMPELAAEAAAYACTLVDS